MFWKYIFPVILCFVFTLSFRQFVEFEFKHKEWKRTPRILVLLFLALGFVPMFNYFVALCEVMIFIVVLMSDGEDSFRIRKLKDTKLNNWLFKS